SPSDLAKPKDGTSIFAQLIISDGEDVTLILESIDLIGEIIVEGTARLTLLLGNDTIYLGPGTTANFVDGSILVTESAALTITSTTPGPDPGALIVIATGADAAIGSAAGQNPGAITITSGSVMASSKHGAGIGGGQGGGSAVIAIDAAAIVKAYAGYDAQVAGSKPAIDGVAGNNGNGYWVNASLDQPASNSSSVDLLVFPLAYSGNNPGDRLDTLTLPFDEFGYRAFAYTTGGSYRVDKLYANLGYNLVLGRTEYRVIERVLDHAQPVYSVTSHAAYDLTNPPASAGSGVLELQLRRGATVNTPLVASIGKDAADLISTGHLLNNLTFVNGGFTYADSTDSAGRPNPVTARDLPWGLVTTLIGDITRNTKTDSPSEHLLVPNTRYWVTAYITASGELYLDIPPGPGTYVSVGVAEFVTLPSITDAEVKASPTPGTATISAQLTGGDEALTMAIYWGTDPFDPQDPESWLAANTVPLASGDYTSQGFTGVPLANLTYGETYYFLIVAENETGYDYYPLTYRYGHSFIFYKVDELGAPLAGVSFRLSPCEAGVCDHSQAQTVTSDDDGLVALTGLIPGRYLLTETATKPGYQLPQGAWYVDFDPEATPVITISACGDPMSPPPAFRPGTGDRVGELELPNYRQTDLPILGGRGIYQWAIAGLILLGCAFALILSKKTRATLSTPPRNEMK
ncbi:MAG: prealbumin-like fold domain-containing protein, partial [Propionibacteriaceae bacterium]|nr:prealbumin-like fold domain-containing protein [Propionibacteriaceae bacterium]